MKLSDPIIVTGAAGFIGSHLVEGLLERGYRVRAFLRYNSSDNRGWLADTGEKDGLEIIRGDIRDYDSVQAAVKGCGTVFHLAALVGIPYSYRSPLAYLKTNMEGSYNILQACLQHGVGNLLMTSTSEVYGEARHFPISEGHPVGARSPYAASKIAADQLALSYHAAFGLPVKIVRPFNVFGPRQSARAVIPAVIAQVLGGQNTIQLGNVHTTRDWTLVEDVVEAWEKIAATEAFIGEVVHIGSGCEISLTEFVERLARLLGREIQIAIDPERVRPAASEVSRLLCDNTKLRKATQWQPAYDFDRGLAKTISWFQKHTLNDAKGRYII